MIYTSSRLLNKGETPALSNVNTTYDNVTTSANSEDIDCTGARSFSLIYTLDSTGVGSHTIQFIIQKRNFSGTYYDMIDEAWGVYKMEDTAYATALNESYGGKLNGAAFIRVRVVASGTTASLKFDVTNMKILLES